MAVLTAAVVLLALLCLLNLAVSAAVIRRLRDAAGSVPVGVAHTPAPAQGLVVGERPAPFSVVATNGTTVDRDALHGPTLVAAFATSCPDCARHAPELLDRAARCSDAGIDRLSLLVDTGPDRTGLAETLGRAGNLVTGDQAAALMRLLRIPSTPAYLLLDADGSVLATGGELDALPLPVH